MEKPVEQPCYSDVRLCAKKINALYKYSFIENIPYEF